jgi:hypothetical protein
VLAADNRKLQANLDKVDSKLGKFLGVGKGSGKEKGSRSPSPIAGPSSKKGKMEDPRYDEFERQFYKEKSKGFFYK